MSILHASYHGFFVVPFPSPVSDVHMDPEVHQWNPCTRREENPWKKMKNHHHLKNQTSMTYHDCFLGFKKCEFFFVGGWIFWNQSTRSISRRLFCQLAPFGAHGLCAVSACASYGCQRWMVWEKHWLQRVPKCCVMWLQIYWKNA